MSVVLEAIWNLAGSFYEVLGLMAPYLLLGFVMAGALSVMISPKLVERHLGGRGIWSILKAAILGVPLPLCSCGVIPVSASLRRHGASKAATVSFLISTPETGVDSILVTYSLLGWPIAIFRVCAAFVSGVVGGLAVAIFGRENDTDASAALPQASNGIAVNGNNVANVGTHAACAPTHRKGFRAAVVQAAKYGLVDLPQDIGKSLLIGLAIAALITVLVPEDFFTHQLGGFFGHGIGSMLMMMALGIPMYVCATASVPMAMAMMMKGISPGAAMVFLIAGPATNAATVGMIWKVMGKRTAIIYLASIACTALAAGLTLDMIIGQVGMGAHDMSGHDHGLAWWNHASAIALAGVLAYAMGIKYVRRSHGPVQADAMMMQTEEFKIAGMTCSHCVANVRGVLLEGSGVQFAEVDLTAGTAVVSGDGLDRAKLRQAIESLGYKVDDQIAR